MANLPDPNLLANLAAELDRVAKVCRLPHGWMAKPSFRLTPQGASLLVVWHPATTAARDSRISTTEGLGEEKEKVQGSKGKVSRPSSRTRRKEKDPAVREFATART